MLSFAIFFRFRFIYILYTKCLVNLKKLFCIKFFLLTNQKKNVLISLRWDKIPTQRHQKQLYINVIRREEMRKKKSEKQDKSQVYIIKLFMHQIALMILYQQNFVYEVSSLITTLQMYMYPLHSLQCSILIRINTSSTQEILTRKRT